MLRTASYHRKQVIWYVPWGLSLYTSTLRQFQLFLLVGWKRMYLAGTGVGNLCWSIVLLLPSLWNTLKWKANITMNTHHRGLLPIDRGRFLNYWKFKVISQSLGYDKPAIIDMAWKLMVHKYFISALISKASTWLFLQIKFKTFVPVILKVARGKS